MIACTRVRIAWKNVASISAATTAAVTARLTSSGPSSPTLLAVHQVVERVDRDTELLRLTAAALRQQGRDS